MDKVNKLLAIPQNIQKSQPWLLQRKNYLTTSNIPTVLGENPYKTRNELLFSMFMGDPFTGNEATKHGERYEDEAIRLYCSATNRKHYSFGLIPHKAVYGDAGIQWLAGSPDGIVIGEDNRPILIEVKCPFSGRLTWGVVPKLYKGQLQYNMEICDIDDGDFIQYIPPNFIGRDYKLNVVREYRDREYFNNTVLDAESFWKEYTQYKDHYDDHPSYNDFKK